MVEADGVLSGADEARVARTLRSLRRSRVVFALLAVLVPSTLYLLLERQARRLAALGDHGVVTQATVTGLLHQGGETYVEYTYQVEGKAYTWSVDEAQVPSTAGESFPLVYLPEAPSLSRPGSERSVGTTEAAANRRFAWKLGSGLFAFLATALVLTELQLRRLVRRGIAEIRDPKGYRRRLIGAGILGTPLLVLVTGYHVQDALSKGESLWPVLIGLLVSVAAIAGTFTFLFRKGPTQVAARTAGLMRWVFPLSMGIATLLALVRWWLWK